MNGRLPMQDKMRLLGEAGLMYFRGGIEKRVAGEHYEGTIKTTGRYQMLVDFGGQRFDAELETTYGKANFTFLISEPARNRSMRNASMN